MSTYTIKVNLKEDIRRIKLPTSTPFTRVEEQIAHVFSGASVARITWKDEDGDVITVRTEADWSECTHHFTSGGGGKKSVIRLSVKLEEPEKASITASPDSPHVSFDVGGASGAGTACTTLGTAEVTATPPAATTTSAATTPETCHLTMIIDRSGSMSTLGDSVLSGIQTYLQELAAVDERDGSSTSVLFSTFDDKYKVIHDCLPIKEAQAAITARDIEPRGMTALHDAIGYGLRDTRAAIKAMGPGRKPGKVVVFILTDGQENSSKKWNSVSVRKQIAKLEAAPYNYAFFFAAAGQDALDTGARIGLGADDCITWTADSRAASACFDAVAEATTSHRRGMSKAFTPVHRRSTCTGDTATTTPPRRRSHHTPSATSILKSKGLYGSGVVGSDMHTGVVCDVSGMNPIVGIRYHKIGSNYDLCHAEFEKLPHAQRSRFEVVVNVGDTPVPYSTSMTHLHPHPHSSDGRLFAPAAPVSPLPVAPAPLPVAPAQVPAADRGGEFAASARSSALAKKWERELAELDGMGLAIFRDGMPELLEQTNGSIAEALEILMP